MLGYIRASGDKKQSTIYLGGNIIISGNERENNVLANLPLEIVPDGHSYADTTYRHFNAKLIPVATESFTEYDSNPNVRTDDLLTLRDGVEDTRIGVHAEVYFTPINSIRHDYADTITPSVRAAGTMLFKVEGDDDDYVRYENRFVQNYDGGSGGAVVSQNFHIDTEGAGDIPCADGGIVYENRVVYANRGGIADKDRIMVIDSADLIRFEFDMVYETDFTISDVVHVRKIPDQMVLVGSTVIQPIKDYSLAVDSAATIYTDDGNYKVIDIIGNAESIEGTNPLKRFNSWDWGTRVSRPADGLTWTPKLTAIYAVVNHFHKPCGCANGVECNHLGDTTQHADFGGDCNAADGNLNMTCIDVHQAKQLFYIASYSQYMYVLSDDIVIGDDYSAEHPTDHYDRVDGVLITDVLNDPNRPIKDIKICLNGHKITMRSKQSLFAIYGNCTICDCQANKTNSTITYADNTIIPDADVTGGLFNFIKKDGVNNSLGIYGVDGDPTNPYITFENLRIKNSTTVGSNQGFVTGLNETNANNALRLENVRFANSIVSDSLFKVSGDVSLDNVVVDTMTINSENNSIIDLKEKNNGAASTDTSSFNIRSGEYKNNTIESLGSSILHIESVNDSNIYLQDAADGTRMSVKNNKVRDVAAFRFGVDNPAGTTQYKTSKTKFTMKSVDFTYNYVEDFTGAILIRGGEAEDGHSHAHIGTVAGEIVVETAG